MLTAVLCPPAVNGVGEDAGGGVMLGKVVRPLRSVDPTQTEYQGLIEVAEEGGWCLSTLGVGILPRRVNP